jgi:hypothetical protein
VHLVDDVLQRQKKQQQSVSACYTRQLVNG